MSGTTTLLSAVSTNGAGTAYNTTALQDELSLAVSVSGTVTAFSVQLQGSIDGTNYENVGEAVLAPTAGVNVSSGVQYQYFQAVLAGYAGTGTVTCTLAYNLRAGSGGGGSGPPTGAAGGVLSGTYPNPGLAASPALTGTPTAPTATALTSTTQVATTAFTTSAVSTETTRATTAENTNATAVSTETSRAEAAEALLAPLASPALTGTPTAPTKTALTSNTDIATTAYADSAVAVETSRAETAEALALPKTGGTMSGAIAMGASKVTGLANGSGAQDAAAFGQIPAGGTTVTIAAGGTGQTTAAAGFNALNPNAAAAGFTPSNPTGTTSTTLVMMGLGATCAYTPASSGQVLVSVTGQVYYLTAATDVGVGPRYGTGTAPSNGNAVTGTRFGGVGDASIKGPSTASANTTMAVAFTALLTLTPATAYWFDLSLSTTNNADAVNIVNVSMTFIELPAG